MRSRSARLRELRQHRLVGGVLQRDEPLALAGRAPAAACAAAPICSGDRPSSSATLSTTTAPSVVALSTFCLKRRGERGDLLVELLQARLLRRLQARAGAHEQRVVARQQLQRLGIEVQASRASGTARRRAPTAPRSRKIASSWAVSLGAISVSICCICGSVLQALRFDEDRARRGRAAARSARARRWCCRRSRAAGCGRWRRPRSSCARMPASKAGR